MIIENISNANVEEQHNTYAHVGRYPPLASTHGLTHILSGTFRSAILLCCAQAHEHFKGSQQLGLKSATLESLM